MNLAQFLIGEVDSTSPETALKNLMHKLADRLQAPPSQFSLLTTRRFLPLFVAQALGAFNDNGLRYAISILIIYDLADRLGIDGASFIALGTALFIAPYFLFSALAGQLADKYDKAMLARRVKFAEIGIMAAGWLSLYLDQVWLHLAILFLAGTQAAFFSPVKYGLLPQHLHDDELLGGNGLIEMTTFVSILLGVLFGGFLVLQAGGKAMVGATITILSVVGYLMTRHIPPAPPPAPDLSINWRLISETRRIIGFAAHRSDVLQAIIGISWFWFIGALMLTLFPVFTKDVLLADENVANLFVATFTVGIGLGSLLANRLLSAEISPRFVPVAAVLMTVFLLDLYFATGPAVAQAGPGGLRDIAAVLSGWPGWRVVMDLLFISLFGGLFVVPLNALMQSRAAPPRRARVIAANNVLNALFMTLSSALATVGFRAGMSAPDMFLLLGLANAVAAAVCIALLPRELFKSASRLVLRMLHRVDVIGIENYRAAGARTVIVANHPSTMDGLLLHAFIPDRCVFAVGSNFAGRWWMKPAQRLADVIAVDLTSPPALKKLAGEPARGRRLVMFPEGRISVTGSLMKIDDAPAVIAHLAGAKILPLRIEGAQYSLASKMRGKLRRRLFPKITVTFLEPVTLAPGGADAGALRESLAQKLYEVMTQAQFRTSIIDQHLIGALLDARSAHGGATKVLEDVTRVPISYSQLILATFVLGRRLARLTRDETTVGVLLPNVNGCLITFFGLHAFGRVPAMLNYSTGAMNMAAACVAARIATIVTSRRFIEQAQMEAALATLAEKARIIYLEDVRKEVGLADKLYGLVASRLPRLTMKLAGVRLDANAPAVILFTSGSEGVPKGVVLSHRNINANRHQVAARIAFDGSDIAFNALPLFHALGLTGGALLPLLAGVRTFLYPSPLHYKVVPQLCYESDATILFGTDTFLMGYARNAHPYDFYSVRYVVAGAERVKEETRNIWMDKFGLRILEGYGATECSPVVSVNTPLQFKAGTTGRLLDGIEYRLEPVEGIGRGGRLVVHGPNVMLGYLRAGNPGVLEPPPGGWYDTGDIVDIDDLGYIAILGRAKRFAKIAGEMISLTAVEAVLGQAFPDHAHAVVAVPDVRKGEQLVMITTRPNTDRKEVAAALKQQGVHELMVPRFMVEVAELPVLGSGKTDYVSLSRLARDEVTR